MIKKLNPRAEKLVENIIQNSLTKNKTKNKKELLIESGYSLASAKNPDIVLSGQAIQAELARRNADTVKKLEDIRALMLAELPKKTIKAPINHLITGVDVMTKNIQLLSGKATENKAIKIEISQEIADKNTVIEVLADEVIQ